MQAILLIGMLLASFRTHSHGQLEGPCWDGRELLVM